MALVNVYVPSELMEEARRADLDISGLTQDAIRRALAARRTTEWLEGLAGLPPTGIGHTEVRRAVDDNPG